MRYGLLSYSTTNLGDEIQSIAARRFLPAVDCLVDRDHLNAPDIPDCKLILNGWHTHRPENWPPSPAIDPLLISFHLTNEVFSRNINGINPTATLLKGKNLEYLKQHGPVGTRDTYTRDLLRNAGVDAYFSGCLTLTLGNGEQRIRGEYVCASDLNPAQVAALRERTRAPVIENTPNAAPGPFDERMTQAERLLDVYANARCVVTTRLHCALPCLAFGTPVLLLTTADDKYRFSGLLDLLRHCTASKFIKGRAGFDLDHPTPNARDFLRLREDLIARVSAFTRTDTQAVP